MFSSKNLNLMTDLSYDFSKSNSSTIPATFFEKIHLYYVLDKLSTVTPTLRPSAAVYDGGVFLSFIWIC